MAPSQNGADGNPDDPEQEVQSSAAQTTATEDGAAVTHEQRWRMIAEAAYFRAEKRGFLGGEMADDWMQAEAEIDAMLAEKK